MRRLIGRRLSLLLPVLFGLSLLVFLWIHALPGGPGAALLGEHSTPAAIAQINRAYGLNQPVFVQYWDFLQQAVHLRFGNSVMTGLPVITEIRQAFPATIELSVAALIFAVGVGIPLGYLMARRFGSKFDQVSMGLSLLGISVPIFFLGYLLKYVFAIRLGWLPSDGRLNPTDSVAQPTGFYVLDGIIDGSPAATWDAVRHLILPAITLGSIPLAIVIRITRAAVLDVINEDHVRTAKSMGLRPQLIRSRYILRNAMTPISTTIGLQVGLLLSGAVLTETVYAWNGMGTLLYQAILNRDFAVLEGGILLLAVIFVVVNLIVDVSYAFLDPRIRMR